MASNITTLVEKAKQGDADAFSTLYQMYYPKMKGICINILREDKAVVDDLVQDAFILAFVSLKDLKNTHNIRIGCEQEHRKALEFRNRTPILLLEVIFYFGYWQLPC